MRKLWIIALLALSLPACSGIQVVTPEWPDIPYEAPVSGPTARVYFEGIPQQPEDADVGDIYVGTAADCKEKRGLHRVGSFAKFLVRHDLKTFDPAAIAMGNSADPYFVIPVDQEIVIARSPRTITRGTARDPWDYTIFKPGSVSPSVYSESICRDAVVFKPTGGYSMLMGNGGCGFSVAQRSASTGEPIQPLVPFKNFNSEECWPDVGNK